MTRSISLIMLVSALMGFQMPSIASANEVELKAYSADEAVNLDLNNLTDADKLSDMLDNQSFMPPGGPGRGGPGGPGHGGPGPRPMPPGPGPRPGPGPGPGHPPYNPGPGHPPYNPGPRPPYNPGPRPYPPYNPGPRPVPPPYYPPYPSQPYVTCYSQNYRGEVFSASGYEYTQNVQQRALEACFCSYDPNGCVATGCRY